MSFSISSCRTCPASTPLEEVKADPALSDIPIVVFTGRALSADEDAQLRTMARSVVVKGVESPERLLDETALLTPNASVVLRDHFVSGSREVAEVATPKAMHSANARANLE